MQRTQPTFKGSVGTTIAESTPWWPPTQDRAARRPNVVLIILDDTGWSDLGCFGSEIATPTFDRLADNGVRFNRFHVTPLCSPTRASLLSGRNHHAVGMRFLADTDTGFPNSRGAIRQDVELLPQILRDHGYGTYLVGKWHLTPLHEITPAGPYDNWPLSRGFNRFFGFLDGCTDQYEPELYEDNHPLRAVPSGHLSEALADHAITYLYDHATFRPDSPFFLQFALGATHAPFQAPREYIEKYIQVFTKGWDQTRVDRLRRQVELSLVPSGTELTDPNDGVPAWDDLDAEQQHLFARLQAAFAGFLEHADAQVGRVLDAIHDLGETDDTIVLLLSDNGASREGGPYGDVDTNAPYSGVYRPARDQLDALDGLGTVTGGAHYPEGWAMAGNTPFRNYKQFVDLGGVRSPLILSWPGASETVRGVRDQFVHVVDIAPTILELVGLRPTTDMDGVSVAASLDEADVGVGRTTQYWETMGHRALWHDGWKAVTAHVSNTPYEDDVWRLYNTDRDFSERRDLATEEPDRLRALVSLWWQEAAHNDVFPLDDRPLRELIAERGPIGIFAETRILLRPGQSHVPFPSAVTGSNRDMDLVAKFSGRVPRDGVLVSSGNAQGGYLFYLLGAELCFEHQHLGEHMITRAPLSTPDPGSLGLRLRTGADGSASIALTVAGVEVSAGRIAHHSAHLSFWGLDVGHLATSTFSRRISPPFSIPDGSLEHIEMTVHPNQDDADEYAASVLAGE